MTTARFRPTALRGRTIIGGATIGEDGRLILGSYGTPNRTLSWVSPDSDVPVLPLDESHGEVWRAAGRR